jgi:uncharacterized protein (TIGR03086 family)
MPDTSDSSVPPAVVWRIRQDETGRRKPMDLVTAYRRSLAGFTERVAQVRPDQWPEPTPCDDWDVRALVNHLVNEDLWTPPLVEGRTIAEVGDRFDGDLLGDDPAGSAARAARQAEDAVAAPGALARTVHLSFGDAPATEYIYQLLADHLVHSWDLAVATGSDPRLDDGAVGVCADWFADREDVYRGAGVIADRVPVPEPASAQDRLIAAFGRDPAWRPPAG